MKKYKLVQEFGVMEEDATPIKDFSVHLLLKVENIEEDRVVRMLEEFSKGFTDLIQEENNQVEKSFAALNEKLMRDSEKNGKGWFK